MHMWSLKSNGEDGGLHHIKGNFLGKIAGNMKNRGFNMFEWEKASINSGELQNRSPQTGFSIETNGK